VVRSRLAPSPTGHLHLGNARTFLLTWLHVRAAGGSLVLRVDDLDGPRVRQEAVGETIEDLTWLGLHWDAEAGVLVQSRRAEVYAEAADGLLSRGLAYPCVCTRSEIGIAVGDTASSAPHGPEGPRYPGTCRGRWSTRAQAEAASGKPACLRLKTEPGQVRFDDLLYGPQAFDPSMETGDFVIHRNNGVAAYQLATVIDDAESGVDLVIRGSDLLSSTARQRLLQTALGLPMPQVLHVPLVVGEDGRRLAKRHGDTSIRRLRELGWSAAALLARLGATAGLCGPEEEVTLGVLLARYDLARLSTAPVVFTPAWLARRPA
jgi:glutamyl-tRNA synthetase